MDNFQDIHEIQSELNKKEIFFYYSGYVTEDLLLSAGKMIRQKLELVQVDRKISRAIFAIFVEESQNIIRYSKAILASPDDDVREEGLRHGFVMIGKKDEKYYVCCGNVVLNADAEKIQKSLEDLQKLDAEGLKVKYKEAIRKPPPEGSKGAGLGFIDIARKAKGGFHFDFKSHDTSHKYFYLKAYA